MSYGLGRPAIVREDGTIHNCRLLLDHPLSLESDVRLIYSVELLALRAPLHVELTAAPDEPLDTATLARLRWANDQFDAWERYWDDILFARYAPTNNTTFVHDSLAVQRQLAELFINSQLLRGVHSPEDVEAMSAEKRALALRALGNALRCVHYTLRGKHVSYAVCVQLIPVPGRIPIRYPLLAHLHGIRCLLPRPHCASVSQGNGSRGCGA